MIAVIGDARVEPGSEKDLLAEALGRALVDAGYRVVTGGLGGVMESACRGARQSARYAHGDTIGLLPGHNPADANPFVDIPIATGLDHARNSIVAHADAVIAVGGGAGTLAEMCFAWIYRRLVIGMTVSGWSGELAGRPLDTRTRYPDLPKDCVHPAKSAEQAVELLSRLLEHHARQHRGIVHRQGV